MTLTKYLSTEPSTTGRIINNNIAADLKKMIESQKFESFIIKSIYYSWVIYIIISTKGANIIKKSNKKEEKNKEEEKFSCQYRDEHDENQEK